MTTTALVPVPSNDAATPKRIGGVTGRGFLPGKSGNPRGRLAPAASLATYVQKQSKSGKELVDFLLSVMRADTKVAGDKGYVPMQWRMEAAGMLLERGFGKPVQPTEHTGEDGAPITFRIVYEDRAIDPNG